MDERPVVGARRSTTRGAGRASSLVADPQRGGAEVQPPVRRDRVDAVVARPDRQPVGGVEELDAAVGRPAGATPKPARPPSWNSSGAGISRIGGWWKTKKAVTPAATTSRPRPSLRSMPAPSLAAVGLVRPASSRAPARPRRAAPRRSPPPRRGRSRAAARPCRSRYRGAPCPFVVGPICRLAATSLSRLMLISLPLVGGRSCCRVRRAARDLQIRAAPVPHKVQCRLSSAG